MKATWQGHVIAESDQTIELDGYQGRNPCERARAAWAYQAPRTSYARIAHWIGFWNDVDLQD